MLNTSSRRAPLRLLALLLVSMALPGQEAREGPAEASKQTKTNAKRIQERRERDGVEEDDAQARAEWMRQRMGGALPREFWLRLVAESAKVRQAHPRAFKSRGEAIAMQASAVQPTIIWNNLGPTSATKIQNGSVTLNKVDSGRVRTILPHPTDPNTLYVGTAHGGLWKTSNFLAATPTWTPLTDFLGTTSIGSVAFGRTSQTLYMGMGDPFGSGAGYGNAVLGNNSGGLGGEGTGGFVFRSLDGGATWSVPVILSSLPPTSGLLVPTTIWDLKVDTSASQDVVLVATNAGIQRSTDGGATYTTALPNVLAYSIVQTSLGWLASTQSFQSDPFNSNPAFHLNANPGVLYLSQDHGASWSAIANPGGVLADLGRTTLAVGTPGGLVVYAFAQSLSTGNQKDLFRSTDGGNSWTALGLPVKTPTNPNADQTNMNIMAGQAVYNQLLTVDPADPTHNTVYIGGQLSSAKTTNGGDTWTLVSNSLPGGSAGTTGLPYVHADMHAAATSGNLLIFGTDGGLFVSSDGGQSWDDKKNTGLVTHLVHSMSCFGDGILVGLQDNGTRVRVGATSVFDMTLGGDGFGTGWSPTNAVSLSTYTYGTVYRSTVNPPLDSSNWAPAASGLVDAGDPTKAYFFTPIVTAEASADPQGLTFLTYTQRKVFKTTNGGTSWTLVYNFFDPVAGLASIPRAVMHGAAFGPSDTQHIAVPGAGGILLWTELGFNGSWTGRSLSTPAYPGATQVVSALSTAAYADNTHLYLGSESPLPNAVHVVRVTASGSVLTDVSANGNLPDVPVTKLVVDRTDATGNTVFAATWIGLFRTTDGGTTWAPYGTGLPQMPISDLYLSPNSSILRVATFGRGVWEATTFSGPIFTLQPANVTVLAGQPATFTAQASGSPTPTYQWRKNATNIGGATSTTYTVPVTAIGDAGSYDVVATNTQGTATSNAATLTVNAGPSITTQPQGLSVIAGQGAMFSVAATGTAPLTYQWRKNGSNIGGATSSTYNIASVVAGDAGNYDVVVTNAFGTTTSAAASLTVATVAINVTPGDKTLLVGASQSFTASITGSSDVSVNWNLVGSGTLSAITASSVTFTASAVGTSTLRATSNADTARSKTITLITVTADLNADGTSDVLDLAFLVNREFKGFISISWNLTSSLSPPFEGRIWG